jgi:hypothetical protein
VIEERTFFYDYNNTCYDYNNTWKCYRTFQETENYKKIVAGGFLYFFENFS